MKHRRQHDHEHRKPRRRLKVLAVLLTFVLVLLIGEFLASRLIADKLRATVDSKLDARLELGPLIYVPPYGVLAWDARIVREGHELFAVSRVKLALAEFPLKDKPIIISKLDVHQPVLNIAQGRFDKIAKPSGDPQHPHKLSDVLRLKEVRVTDGQVTYTDLARPTAPPTVWGNLALDVDTIQKSVSKYTFHLVSRAAPLAEVTAAGTIDVDDLLLEVQSSTMKLRAEPEPSRSPLPAAAQEFIRQRQINGAISISGNGKIPLRDPKQSNFSAAVALQNATMSLPPNGAKLDYARASLVAKMSPGGPVSMRIDRVEVAGAGKQVIISEGQVELNAAKQTWSVADIDGQVIFTQPTTRASDLALVAPLRELTTPVAGAQTQPAADEPRGIDKLQIAGKGDFTAVVSGPFDLKGKNPWEAIRHEIIIYPRDASFRPKNFAHRIEGIGGGEVRLQDGMVIFQELDGHYGDDLIRLRSARLPVEGLPKLARWQEISGTVVFHRPVRRYNDKLDKIIDPLKPNGSFLIAGSWTVDKREESLTPEGKPKNTFDLIVSTDTGSFSLTKHNILIEKMRGDASVSNAGVDLHELQAEVLDGTLQATGRWNRESKEHSKYETELLFRNVDIALLEDRLRDEPASKPLEGRLYAGGTLRGEITKGVEKHENLRTMDGNGEIEIIKGSLFKVPVLKNVTEQIKGLKNAATVGDAAAEFDIEKGRVKLRNAAISSPAVGLQGGGMIALDGTEMDLHVVAAPLADWRENLKSTKIPIVSNVAGELAGGIQKMLNAATGVLLYEFRVQGAVNKPEVIAVPTPVLTDTAAFVFEKMLLTPKKDQRPIDLLRRDREQAPRAETR